MKIYLDYNATTPIDPEVADSMKPYLSEYFGNPSSSHSFGTKTKLAVEKARKQVASLIQCKPNEIIFTSGGTESNNYAIKGYAFANMKRGNHIITSAIEHPAVSEVCRYLEGKGFRITYIGVDEFGRIDLDELENSIGPEAILISIMHANNEIGTIQPISQISQIAKKNNVAFHTDAAQSVGKYSVDTTEMGVDLLSIAGHKLYAPKGVGALYIREGITLEKLIHGADHEQNKRAGTENVLEIVGLGKACEIARRDIEKNIINMTKMRDMLYSRLKEKIPDIKLNGHPDFRLPNTLNISFYGLEANVIINELELKGIAASAGAACHTDSIEISPVIKAIGLNPDLAMGTVRFSVGKFTTKDEIERSSQIIIQTVNSLRPYGKTNIEQPENSDVKIKLTKYTQGLGCACKLRPQELEKVLKLMPVTTDPNVLIDIKTSDDAAVYKIDENTALVQTVDFFTPVVDNPYDFGAVAAANALSDVYAMGAKPLFALNIVGFPSNRLPLTVLSEILRGASDKAKQANISILGGHTIDDSEPKYGMTVCGIVHPQKIWSNSGAKEGDAIILTKPIGTGILTTALKKGLLSKRAEIDLIKSMSELNDKAANVLSDFSVHACTDVTGFGLIGHLSELTTASGVDAEIFADSIPVFAETKNLAAANIVPGGSTNNLNHFSKKVIWGEDLSEITKIVLCDAQTSGGLLFAVPKNESGQIIDDLKKGGIKSASHIGNCLKRGKGLIFVKKSK
ncbi:selenide, water dikinase SelD [candidate division WOR-3 bacterium]|nr:selenide, water dikinase SelD [candidate division WOR-3 bacterium]